MEGQCKIVHSSTYSLNLRALIAGHERDGNVRFCKTIFAQQQKDFFLLLETSSILCTFSIGSSSNHRVRLFGKLRRCRWHDTSVDCEFAEEDFRVACRLKR